jgi:proteasome lid subunit RPN8/RPN11
MDAETNSCVKGLVVSDRIDEAKPLKKECPYALPAPFPFLRIFVRRNVVDAILAEGKAAGANEIGAMLVGRPFEDEAGPYLVIDGHIPARHTSAGAAHVTFTAETWTHALEEREKHFPESMMVGWAHTHPSYGVFLSGHDVFIHRSFFDTPWLVAYVVDPQSGADGFFAWKDGEIRPVEKHYLLESDEVISEARFSGDSGRTNLVEKSHQANGALLELKSIQERIRVLDRRVARMERIFRVMAPLVGLLLALAVALAFDRFPIVREIRNLIGAEITVPSAPAPGPQQPGNTTKPRKVRD